MLRLKRSAFLLDGKQKRSFRNKGLYPVAAMLLILFWLAALPHVKLRVAARDGIERFCLTVPCARGAKAYEASR